MNKKKFLKKLNQRLYGLRRNERKRYIQDYEELLTELMEDGKSEEEAVLKLGDTKQIAKEILEHTEKRFGWIDWKGKGLLILSFLSVVVVLMNNWFSRGIVFWLRDGDGPTSVFVAGKISVGQWSYILMGVLVGVTGVYLFWKRKVEERKEF